MKSQLMKSAWAIRQNLATFAEALVQAWKTFKLKSKMKTNNVIFKFRKVSGEIRNAVGTLNISYEAKGGSTRNYGVISYYDCEYLGFRLFRIENLIG